MINIFFLESIMGLASLYLSNQTLFLFHFISHQRLVHNIGSSIKSDPGNTFKFFS